MNRITPRTLSGFMELEPKQQVYFDNMLGRLRNSFSLYGFTSLDTPLMEAAEVLLAKSGGETEKQIYTLRKGDTDLALRYELTTSLAKYVALHYNELTFPFRRFEIGKVYRGERAQRGRFREFYQADIDIIGDGSLSILNDAEIPSVIYRCLTSLGLKSFVIHISNRKILSGLFKILEIGDIANDSSGIVTNVMRAVDKLAKIGVEKLHKTLTDDLGLSVEQSKEIIEFVTFEGNPFDILDKYKGRDELFDVGIDELNSMQEHLKDFGVPDSHFVIDLSIVRGLDYYTGSIFETYLTDFPEVGSICGGGRYDNLADHFTNRKMPGIGVAIGLTRLFYILQEQNLLHDTFMSSPADILIIPMTDDLSHAIKLATSMRETGLRTQIYFEDKKFKSKISYADKLNIPYVVFLGEDEIEKGFITVKDMVTGDQTTASLGMLAAGIYEKIKTLREGVPISE